MSSHPHTETCAAMALPWKHALRDCVRWIIGRLRAAQERRRQRQELRDYLASDHRAAADLGIGKFR